MGDDDAESLPALATVARKIVPDFEADARLKEALKSTSPDLLEMVPIAGGTYMMGSLVDLGSHPAGWLIAAAVGGEALVNQGPQHEVTVDGFYLGKYEVTVEQFLCFLNAIEAKNQEYLFFHKQSPVWYKGKRWLCEEGHEHQAADTVTWYGAKAFCKWLTEQTGDVYRLPTEAEWEWAARGKEGRLYPWGVTFAELPVDDDEDRKLTADIRGRADWGGSGWLPMKRRPVGSFPAGATPEGICDMVGGVWEWCEDRFASRYDTSQKVNPRGPTLTFFGGRALRGGTENVPGVGYTQTTTRMAQSPDCHRDSHIYGMRLLREVKAADSVE